MKRSIAIFVMLLFPAMLPARAPGITEENYLKQDSILWARYERDVEAVFTELDEHPERKDSLRVVYDAIEESAEKRNVELAVEYASVPSGFRRLFMVRLDIPKERLRSVFEALPEVMRSSQTGRSIQMHLDTEQTKEGDRYYDFKATIGDGAPFKLSSLAGKNVLFLYGGMDCMGPDGRDYLNALYEKTSRDDFEIVVYCLSSGPEALRKVREMYPCKFALVSDFLQNNSPVKILYGAQETPTCFFIDREGVVRMKTVGLYSDKVDELMAKSSKNSFDRKVQISSK